MSRRQELEMKRKERKDASRSIDLMLMKDSGGVVKLGCERLHRSMKFDCLYPEAL